MKKRRLHVRVLACLLTVCVAAGVFLACFLNVSLADDGFVPSEQMTEAVRAVEKLERATEKYYKTSNTFDYTTRYIRSGVYADVRWQMMVGTIDPAYEEAMKPYEALRNTGSLAVMTDRSGELYCVDFSHMAAAADAKRDFAGWAGDLITLAAEISSLQEARLMLGNETGVFGTEDIHADIDALNLWAIAKENGGSLAKAMRSYYLEGGVEYAATAFLLRETGLGEEELSVESIYTSFYARINGESCQSDTLALENIYGVAGSEALQHACRAFSEWLYYAHCGETIGHEDGSPQTVLPTCTEDGYTCVACRRCGRTKYTDTVPAVSHAFAETRTEPTEGEPGIIRETCKICGFCTETAFDSMETGDLNCDGSLNALDYMWLKRGVLGSVLLSNRQKHLADLNGDGLPDQNDCLLCCERLGYGRNTQKG